ncbi:unnamed protein product [Rotaria socialis]|uniref:Tyrosine-protein kinase ephrin type A/B receptor-like domain-containing protein n=1 Tax=Rotaria socialis TaxID=392032 RepID=A0A817WK52_9BILA|nr:unnamed protein product [Rotaria socialis]
MQYCPSGTYQPVPGSYSIRACLNYSIGTYNPSVGQTSCYSCPVGSYCDVIGSSNFLSCPSGTYQSSMDSISAQACLNCRVGNYSPSIGQASCLNCPLGYYCDSVGASSARICPSGTYQPIPDSISVEACLSYQDFVICDICRTIVTYKSSTGTGGLKKHLASCDKSTLSNTTQSTITTYYTTSTPSIIPEKIKKRKYILETVFKAGKITANSQSIEISDLLPYPTTVSRKVDQVYSFRKKQLTEWFKTINSYAVVIDMWTEKYSDNLLHDYGLSLNTNSFIVSDNEPKMLAALRGVNRVGCSDHYINKALEHAFTSPKSIRVEVIQVFDTNVFNITYNELVDAFSGSHYNDFESLDKDLLYQLYEFLRSFDEVITTLSEETQPALHKVIPLQCFLINHCTPKTEDISGMMKIKLFLKERIMDKWPIQSEHLLATLLHPRLRDFSGDQALKDRAIELLQPSISSSADSPSNNISSCNSSSSPSVDNSITPKKTNILSLCYDKPRTTKPALDEIMLWLQSDFSKDFINDDLLLF